MTTKNKINDLKDTAICRICNTNNIEKVNDILNEEIEKAPQSQKQKIESWEKLFEEEQTGREQAQEEVRKLRKELKSQKQKIIEEIKRLQIYGSDGKEKIYYINAEELLNSLGEKE